MQLEEEVPLEDEVPLEEVPPDMVLLEEVVHPDVVPPQRKWCLWRRWCTLTRCLQ